MDVVADGGATETVGSIGAGLCVLVGVTPSDTAETAVRLADRFITPRSSSKIRRFQTWSAADVAAAVLVVSQFTLYGDTSRGRRPSWIAAARPEQAEPLVEHLVAALRGAGATVATGRFRTAMRVSLVNDGPVTVMLER